MTVLFEDVENVLAGKDIQITVPDYVLSSDLLYADDTVLIGNDTHTVQILLNTLVECGYAYGLEINWKKKQSLNLRILSILYDPHVFLSRALRKLFIWNLLSESMRSTLAKLYGELEKHAKYLINLRESRSTPILANSASNIFMKPVCSQQAIIQLRRHMLQGRRSQEA